MLYNCGVSESCKHPPCPEDGAWTLWAKSHQQGLCSVSCGFGLGTITEVYGRSCTNPVPRHGGKECKGLDIKYKNVHCSPDKLCTETAAGWSHWNYQNKGVCSVSCGSGIVEVAYTRLCNNPPPKRGQPSCEGTNMKIMSKTCDKKIKCAVHGGWGAWTFESVSSCSASCGIGKKRVYKRRLCDNPAPQHGGRKCLGQSVKSGMEKCDTEVVCAVDGGWNRWIKKIVGKCSVTCGSGTKIVSWTRICNNPTPTSGGRPCVGNSTDTTLDVCKKDIPCNVLVTSTNNALEVESRQVSESNTGAIVGSLVGVLVCVCLVIGGVMYYRKLNAATNVKNEKKKSVHHNMKVHHNPAFEPE